MNVLTTGATGAVGPVRIAAGMIEDAMRLIGRRSPIGRATIEKYIEDIAVEGQRIRTELGFSAETRFETWLE